MRERFIYLSIILVRSTSILLFVALGRQRLVSLVASRVNDQGTTLLSRNIWNGDGEGSSCSLDRTILSLSHLSLEVVQGGLVRKHLGI